VRFLALVFTLLAPAAYAGSLPNDPLVQLLIRGETDPVILRNETPFGIFEGTLSERAAMYDVSIRNDGLGDYSYICLTDGQWAVWMLSDRTSADNEPMLTALVETVAPQSELPCNAVDELHMLSEREDQPGIAVTVDDLPDTIDLDAINDGLISLQGQSRMGDGGHSWLAVSTITYHVAANGSIDGVAYEVVTVD